MKATKPSRKNVTALIVTENLRRVYSEGKKVKSTYFTSVV